MPCEDEDRNQFYVEEAKEHQRLSVKQWKPGERSGKNSPS